MKLPGPRGGPLRAAGLAQVIKSIFTLMAKLLVLPVVLAQAGPMINCTLLKRAPKPMSPKKLYFRNGNTLANISAADSQTRLLRAMGVPLGQLSSAPERARLLATDEAHSILSAQHTQGIQASQYSPYGHRAVENQATALGYNGELLEPFDYYLLGHGNRAYSTRLMRFLSPDRTGIFSINNFNCYAYAAGDPIDYTDPSGNIPNFLKPTLRWLGAIKKSSKQKNSSISAASFHSEQSSNSTSIATSNSRRNSNNSTSTATSTSTSNSEASGSNSNYRPEFYDEQEFYRHEFNERTKRYFELASGQENILNQLEKQQKLLLKNNHGAQSMEMLEIREKISIAQRNLWRLHDEHQSYRANQASLIISR